MKVSVDMSISFLGTAKLDDELEISSKVLGQKGSYCGTLVLIRNKATGELIAEGRHSLFGNQSTKFISQFQGTGGCLLNCFLRSPFDFDSVSCTQTSMIISCFA
ncbi:hypothetical protein GQ457_12G028230 [Hibiscus cannabinus]